MSDKTVPLSPVLGVRLCMVVQYQPSLPCNLYPRSSELSYKRPDSTQFNLLTFQSYILVRWGEVFLKNVYHILHKTPYILHKTTGYRF